MVTNKAFLEELRQAFTSVAAEDHKINQTEFQQALGLRSQYFANRIFSLFDHDGNGTIKYQEFLASVERLISGTNDEKLQFAYCLHDKNNDGQIDREELAQLIAASLSENQLSFPPQQVTGLVDVLLQEADTDVNGEISFQEFKSLLGKSPALLEAMTVSPVSWLKPHQPEIPSTSLIKRWQLQKNYIVHYLQNNWVTLLFLAVYITINLFLAFEASRRYANQGANVYIQIARGCGAALNFNGALILIPVMRNLMMGLRKGSLNNYLPIDGHIEFHKLVGQVMFVLAILHSSAHLGNYLTSQTSFNTAGLTGLLLLIVSTIMWVTAQERVRKGGFFDLFYIVHLGYVLWLVLFLIHGHNFWKWALIPIGGFGIERFIRYRKTKRPTYVVNAKLLSSKVLGLQVERPRFFNFQPSDYVFVKCPNISKFEWHPFTISSAPEERDIVSMHIRAVGSWTEKLHQLFQNQREEWIRADCPKRDLGVPVYLDGPYGSSSIHIFRAKYAVLIAGGIGVTPFASILKSILYRKQNGSPNMRLQKVHFYWLNREQTSFEWFIELLQTLEAEDTDNLFDINLYLTGAQARSDMKSCTLYAAMDVLYSQTQIDLITGLKSSTQTGRPDWKAIFKSLAVQHLSEKVDVFFCGPPGLSRELRKLCNQFGFSYRKENF